MDLTSSACCQLLGVPENAPLDEIRRAYRKLARRLHPDVAGGDPLRFSEITAAYNVLTGRCAAPKTQTPPQTPPRSAADEAEHAKAYAEFRLRAATWHAGNGSRGPRPASEPVAPLTAVTGLAIEPTPVPEARISPAPRPSFWQRLRDRLRAAASTAGSDVYLTLQVDLSTILRGGEQGISIQRAAACPACTGGGGSSCVCGGAGRVLVRERLKLQVPAGARAGTKMRLSGKGNDGLGGRAPGDLYLLLEPVSIAGYLRHGADLRATLEMPATMAEAGGPLNVPTPWGPIRLDVPAATRTGTTFRLQGQGLPVWQRTTRGDLYLQVQVA